MIMSSQGDKFRQRADVYNMLAYIYDEAESLNFKIQVSETQELQSYYDVPKQTIVITLERG